MKFLEPGAESKKLMPLNFQYIDDPEAPSSNDVLFITYRDLETGQKLTTTITNPEIEIYIVKPEYRGIDHIAPKDRVRDFIELKYLEKKTVRYKYRKAQAAKFLNIRREDVMSSTYVLGLDVRIENFYFAQFKLEYGNEEAKIPHICFADIETEIKYAPYTGIAPPGTVPISLITIIDTLSMTSYTFALRFEEYAGFDEFWTQENLDIFKTDLSNSFDETYGRIEYNFLMYTNELEMIRAFWNLVKVIDPDFMEFWNMPFDMGNIIERCRTLGADPGEVAWDETTYDRTWVNFYEDTNKVIHKRRHTCSLPVKTLIVDQMVNYAVIRSGGSKIPDFKLNTIADEELKDKKVEYHEDIGWIGDFPYKDYRKFVKYNIKDVLLQVGIDRKTKDTTDIYGRMYDFSVMPNDIATTTTIVANHYRQELSEDGKVMHNNRNKMDAIESEIQMAYDENFNQEDADSDEEVMENINEEEVLVDENGKKIKFDGAIVLNPTRMSTSGFDNMKYIHNFVIDEDIGAEYPTSIQISNLSNETFIGKVILDDNEDMPFYNYSFSNSAEESIYKNNVAAVALETFAGGDILVGAETFLGMPGVDEVMKMLDLSKIIKPKDDD